MADRYGLIRGNVEMLFYTTSLVACVLAAVLIPWFYRLASKVGTTVQRSLSPRDTGPVSHLPANPVTKDQPVILACTGADVKSKRDNSYLGPRNDYSAPLQAKVHLKSEGWIRREDRMTTGGRTYKVNRRLKVREQKPEYVSKPKSWA